MKPAGGAQDEMLHRENCPQPEQAEDERSRADRGEEDQ